MILETKQLYEIQDILDNRIFQKHELTREDTTVRRILALLVEVSELANETRCFKFWSNKQASEKKIILEEYVDGIHFLLSIGIDLQVTPKQIECEVFEDYNLTNLFISVYEKSCFLKSHFHEEAYLDTFKTYLQIAQALSFTNEDIVSAYLLKNKKNHQRQDTNY